MAEIHSAKITHGCQYQDDVVKSEWRQQEDGFTLRTLMGIESLECHCCDDRAEAPPPTWTHHLHMEDGVIRGDMGWYGVTERCPHLSIPHADVETIQSGADLFEILHVYFCVYSFHFRNWKLRKRLAGRAQKEIQENFLSQREKTFSLWRYAKLIVIMRNFLVFTRYLKKFISKLWQLNASVEIKLHTDW